MSNEIRNARIQFGGISVRLPEVRRNATGDGTWRNLHGGGAPRQSRVGGIGESGGPNGRRLR